MYLMVMSTTPELFSKFNPLESVGPMAIGAYANKDNPCKGAMVGLIIDRLALIIYYWVLGYDYPWMPDAVKPDWFLPAAIAEYASVYYVAKNI